jgi:hypothetical protein
MNILLKVVSVSIGVVLLCVLYEPSCVNKKYYGQCISCCGDKNLERNLTIQCMMKCDNLPVEMAPYDLDKVKHCRILPWMNCASCCYDQFGKGPSTVNCTVRTCYL